jgi:hypothetical protein
MKKLFLFLIVMVALCFSFGAYKCRLVGNGGTKDTILAAAADTVYIGNWLNGAQEVSTHYWIDTIGASSSNLSAVVQVISNIDSTRTWTTYIAKLFGDSITTEITPAIDTTSFYSNSKCLIGTFKHVRFIFSGVYTNQKSILYYYLGARY